LVSQSKKASFAAQGANRGDLRPTDAFLDRELLQAPHCLVTLLEDHRKGALPTVFMKQFGLHRLPPLL
jgi:hypothetical protein